MEDIVIEKVESAPSLTKSTITHEKNDINTTSYC